MNQQESKSPFFYFFKFKNKETAEELLNVISQYEGVRKEEVKTYLEISHALVKSKLLVELKHYILDFWAKNKHLALSDIKGAMDLAFMDIQIESIKKGDEFVRNCENGKA